MLRLAFLISCKRSQPAISGAIGMAHQKDALCAVQQNGHSPLLQNKVAFKVIARRSQSFGAASNNNHVRTQNALPLQKFIYRQTDPLIEAAKHGCVSDVWLGRGIE